MERLVSLPVNGIYVAQSEKIFIELQQQYIQSCDALERTEKLASRMEEFHRQADISIHRLGVG